LRTRVVAVTFRVLGFGFFLLCFGFSLLPFQISLAEFGVAFGERFRGRNRGSSRAGCSAATFHQLGFLDCSWRTDLGVFFFSLGIHTFQYLSSRLAGNSIVAQLISSRFIVGSSSLFNRRSGLTRAKMR
jgi:hypothetical protein